MKIRIFLVLALVGCATQLTPEELETRRQIDLENWNLCELVIKLNNDPTIHVGHVHSRFTNRRPGKAWIVRDDLRSNLCRQRLGKKYWVSYPEAEWQREKRERKEREREKKMEISKGE